MSESSVIYTTFVLISVIFFIKLAINNIENRMVFVPIKLSHAINPYPDVKNIKIGTLDALYYHNDNSDKLIIYSHGNSGNIYLDQNLVKQLGKVASVVVYDYRGYGLSPGTPTEKGLQSDIINVWTYCVDQLHVRPKNIVLYGRSLGCSFTLWLAKKLIKMNKKLPYGIILESGFYNLKHVVTDIYPYMTNFISMKFDNITWLKKIDKKIPTLLLHSKDDELISIKHAYKLVKEADLDESQLYIMTGAHNKNNTDEEYFKKIDEFIHP
jgi:pimeloyl-ACP methyl ester carboxylesterase